MDEKSYQARKKSLIAGFVISLALTLAAYFAVVLEVFVGWMLVAAILLLALAQFIAQMLFFLHIAEGSRWNRFVFWNMVLVVIILVLGSLWIMNNLDSNMMPSQMTDYMLKKAGIHE